MSSRALQSRIVRATPDIAQLRLGCSCAYALEGEAAFWLVDTGTCWDWPLLQRLLHELGLPLSACRGIVLTHAHPDHAGNAARLARLTGAPLYAHPAEQPYLNGKSYVPADARRRGEQGVMFGLGHVFMPVARQCAVPLLHADDVATSAGAWRVIHTPGHTPGHIALYRAADGVLITGDALLNVHSLSRREGLTLPLALYATDTEQAHVSAQQFAALAVNILLPGHGKPVLEDAQTKLRSFLQDG